MVEVTGGASVASKGKLPTRLRTLRAHGNKLLLEDGRWYVDWPMGQHGAIYGYAPPWWVEAAQEAISDGQTASIPVREEQVVAEMLAEFYPDIEAVRFMCTGSDPCAAAVKLARAVTGRGKILVYGYHGSASAYCTPPEVSGVEKRGGTLQAERDAFVPMKWGENPRYLPFRVAAVVVEVPSELRCSLTWATTLADIAHEEGALFVLDEVKTAFRYFAYGAAGCYGLLGKVDLYCFGKTLGNGYPVSCLAGKKGILDELTRKVHYSGTFFGEPVGLAVAKATLQRLRDEPPWNHLYDVGCYLQKAGKRFGGHPTRPLLLTDIDDGHLFRRGHIVRQDPWYITTKTTQDDVDQLMEAMDGC